MTLETVPCLPRRTLLRRAGTRAGGMIVGIGAGGGLVGEPAHAAADAQLPRRVLGRTKVPVGILSLGTGTVGLSPAVSTPQIAEMVRLARELGINFIDLLYFHSVGDRDADKALGPDGVFTWTAKQRQAGKFGGFPNYGKPNLPPMMDRRYLRPALRYAMGLPGVTALNIGPHDAKQLRENVDWAKKYRKLSTEENAMLAQVGRQLADQWGEHFGPVEDRTVREKG